LAAGAPYLKEDGLSLLLQSAGKLHAPGQGVSRENLTRDHSNTCCIQPVEHEGDTDGPLPRLQKQLSDPGFALSERGSNNLISPTDPKLLPLLIQHMLHWRGGLQTAIDGIQQRPGVIDEAILSVGRMRHLHPSETGPEFLAMARALTPECLEVGMLDPTYDADRWVWYRVMVGNPTTDPQDGTFVQFLPTGSDDSSLVLADSCALQEDRQIIKID
jgi:hypothetical protein